MNKKPAILFDIDYTLFDTDFFKESKLLKHKIYDEVIGVLESLAEATTLGIFSKGETEFQKTKLNKTGIGKFFKENNVHIFDDKGANLRDILEKYKSFKLFIVDDKLEILHSAKKHMPQIFTIWVKRGPFAQNQEKIPDFNPDTEIKNLSVIPSLILNT
ncbi:MAG: hypothetical protein A3H79_04295 [Candidatus Levybacteria bacterium RIFCSPLOWO2_02_FULL_36_8b]|nr:MAG: hypothetical protein A3H79_04295 [Candidatus Levybacteria bacterium RIFCSPLOWO2_02_FULL_36_8b]